MKLNREIYRIKNIIYENKEYVYFDFDGQLDKVPGLEIKILNGNFLGSTSISNVDNGRTIDEYFDRFYKNQSRYKTNIKKTNLDLNNCVYLHDLEILPEYRGKGFANILLEKTHDLVKNLGYNQITLIVSKSNPTAQNLYKKFGYKVHQSDGIKDFLYKDINEI